MHIIRSLVKFIGLAAAIWTIGVSIYIVFAPTQSQFSSHIILPDSTTVRQEGYVTKTLIEREGWIGVTSMILGPMLVPILISITAARAAWLHKQGLLWTMVGTMLLFCFLAGFSIGGAYVPAGLAFLLAALLNTIQLRIA